MESNLKKKKRKLSNINLERDDKRMIRKKAKELVDTENQYLHLVVTSKMDDCSEADINDVKRLN